MDKMKLWRVVESKRRLSRNHLGNGFDGMGKLKKLSIQRQPKGIRQFSSWPMQLNKLRSGQEKCDSGLNRKDQGIAWRWWVRRICWMQKQAVRRDHYWKREKIYRIAQLIKKLGNPQLAVWEMPDDGMSYRATYQLPGQPKWWWNSRKKPKKLVLVQERSTSLDDQRTDIKAASSPRVGAAISEADLAVGMDNHQDTRSHSDTMASSPSSKEGIGSLLRF